MKHRTLPAGIGAVLCLGILILDSKTALMGAQDGIQLCLHTVIPSLFPFFVLSAIILETFWGRPSAILHPLGRLFLLPAGADSILIPAFLGGYPVGARTVAALYQSKQLDQAEAQRMLAFCNNPGPAFLFGMGSALFVDKRIPWILWGILLFSALAAARLFPPLQTRPVTTISSSSRSNILQDSIKAISGVCGWVMLLRVVIAFCDRWFLWRFPKTAQILFIGMLELSNGCALLSEISNEWIRFLFSVGMFSFGGVCVTLQTFSVTHGLSKRKYILGKTLQMFLSLVISLCMLSKNWVVLAAIGIFVFVFPIKHKNSSSIPGKAIV